MQSIIHWLYTLPYGYQLLTGLLLWLFIDRRQFNRRGVGGLQYFEDYFTGLITMVLERLLKWLALLLLLRGLGGCLFE